MVHIVSDCRYPHCTAFGRGELQVYLDWLAQNRLSDSEQSFVAFAMGRAGLQDARHLFLAWTMQTPGAIDRKTRAQIRRFFLDPSPEISFQIPAMAGWFNLLEDLYRRSRGMTMPPLQPPVFVKVGFAELPLPT